VSVARTADNADHFIISAYIPLDLVELNSATEKTWMAATDVSNATVNSNLLSN
jgi:hypothetical protein